MNDTKIQDIINAIHSSEAIEGVYENTKFIINGIGHKAKFAGYLRVSEAEGFDKWSSSVSIDVPVYDLIYRDGGPKDVMTIISHVMNMF